MSSAIEFPLYFNCYFLSKDKKEGVVRFKIELSEIQVHPFQLFKIQNNDGGATWQNLSVYASLSDALQILLKELYSEDLLEEVNHGQARVSPDMILDKINQGDRSVSLFGESETGSFRMEFGIAFDDLIQR